MSSNSVAAVTISSTPFSFVYAAIIAALSGDTSLLDLLRKIRADPLMTCVSQSVVAGVGKQPAARPRSRTCAVLASFEELCAHDDHEMCNALHFPATVARDKHDLYCALELVQAAPAQSVRIGPRHRRQHMQPEGLVR
ncbi:hypothetical protein KC349_g71 [Hortaea werneckii]|nr:hypothetical protein KC349_g71 [Hortaea werneckii]